MLPFSYHASLVSRMINMQNNISSKIPIRITRELLLEIDANDFRYFLFTITCDLVFAVNFLIFSGPSNVSSGSQTPNIPVRCLPRGFAARK